jgi:hypothetical protein
LWNAQSNGIILVDKIQRIEPMDFFH